ncbi:MAG: DUF969 domain-containing protein [Xanthomonadales bacterium]|nr:DUF969 domain-containing protein [Xanthomonadales bacterium]
MNYWPLIGVAIVVAGFALRRNPVLVVIVAGLASGLAAGMDVPTLLGVLGKAFVENRMLLAFVLTLPVIGLLERHGLRERARDWIIGLRGLTFARFLTSYLGLRQLLSMCGLTHVAGHAQTVRPLVAPMAEAAAERELGRLDRVQRERVRAQAAATDNIGLFFGEDVFIAFGAVLLVQGFYAGHGIQLEPLDIALWALPSAIAAFVIQAVRIRLARRALARRHAGGADVPP